MLWGFAIFTALVAVWVLWGRNKLKQQPWAAGFFAFIEPIELTLWKKSETILWNRIKQVLALLLVVLPQIGAFDVTPYLMFVPEKHRWWVMLIPSAALSFDATVGEWLRYKTTKPIDLVNVADKDMSPDVAQAMELADTVKQEAVAVVKDAKAEGRA